MRFSSSTANERRSRTLRAVCALPTYSCCTLHSPIHSSRSRPIQYPQPQRNTPHRATLHIPRPRHSPSIQSLPTQNATHNPHINSQRKAYPILPHPHSKLSQTTQFRAPRRARSLSFRKVGGTSHRPFSLTAPSPRLNAHELISSWCGPRRSRRDGTENGTLGALLQRRYKHVSSVAKDSASLGVPRCPF